MNTTTLKERMSLDEDALFEDDAQQDPGMTDEDIKIEALKIATNIAKLMSNVTTEDIVNIAETVAKFIKNSETSTLETVPDEGENPADSEEDFETEDENSEESKEPENSEDTEEDFEV
jgi:hypothetical protein